MGLKEIEKEIRKSGDEEIKKIEAETREIIKNIKKEINEEATIAYNQTKVKRTKELLLIPKKIISDAQIHKRKEISEKRAEILEKVFDHAKKKILKMNNEEKKKILKHLTSHSMKEEIDRPIVWIGKNYAHLLKSARDKFEVKIKEDMDDFGVIIESKDGSLKIDNTLSSVISRVRVQLEPEIVKILFHEKS
jgi:V/A-type H+-transporting ATPase subunit E